MYGVRYTARIRRYTLGPMGTNYYIERPNGKEGAHIGKQSAGWAWHWADVPYQGSIAEQWQRFAKQFPAAHVIDEYGEDCGTFLDFVSDKKRTRSESHSSGEFC